MTLPNKITVARILLIPVFALVAWRYGISFATGFPNERLRLAATGIFIVAAASDCLDGYAARRFNQRTRLGTILDPVADKLLVATAILSIAFGGWPDAFPVWFVLIVIGRDLLLAVGFLMLCRLKRSVTVRPNLVGKLATLLQMTAILWVLIGIRAISAIHLIVPAAIFTLASGISYFIDGVRQTKHAEQRRL